MRMRRARIRSQAPAAVVALRGDERVDPLRPHAFARARGVEQGERLDHCIVGEPTNATRIGEAIKIGRRGSLNGHLRVTGTQGHVAYPHLANNPVKGLLKVLTRIYDSPLDYGSAHFSPSTCCS